MTTASVSIPRVPRAPARTPAHQLAVDSAYLFVGLPLAAAGFVILVAGFALGTGLAVTVIGLPIIAGTLYVARGLADLERRRMAPVLRRPRIRPRYREAASGAGAWRRIITPIADVQSWLDLAYGIFGFVVAIATGVVALAWWVAALVGSLYWAYDWAIPYSSDPNEVTLGELLGLGDSTASRIGLNTALGLFFLITLPLVVRGCALLRASFGRALLTGMAEIRDQISVLEEQKRAAASAEATALRRLERDIHDGPQQRLVRLAMDLSRARQQLAVDPDAARATLDEAVTQTRDTLAELRALSRGIAPPILVDRGLPSALAALAGRGVIPIDLTVDETLGRPGGRLDPNVESTAYFVVAESLTNVAKHSRATECGLTVSRIGDRLVIEVTDNGEGGAHLSKGHGLAGIADRVTAAGGRFDVHSPAGGPTTVRADLPARAV
ncbi:sensor histidine kinase [Plantactinospora sp. GCM10030261]|uniref:sensor histidine kinase n=1 Tax=Plantactinospora sp. GCM10030261 TaxID=3273420 RepID=UPI003618D14A